MRWALALGWLLAAGGLQAEVWIDLESPFHKTAIFESRFGQIQEYEIRSGKNVGANLEMVKLDGSVLLVPRNQVRAILPRLPSDGFAYTQKEAQGALEILLAASHQWTNRTETSPRALTAWKELAGRPSSHEQKRAAQRAEAVQRWLDLIQPEEGKPKPVDLQDYVRQGEMLVEIGGPGAEEVQRQLQKVRNLMAMDFDEIRGKQLPADWGEISPFLPLGLLAVLFVLGFWVVGNLGNFSSALKAGVIRTSSKGKESRTTLNLKGILYLIYAVVGGALIYFLLQPGPLPGSQGIGESVTGLAERAFYLSMNAQKRWSTQAKSSLEVEATAVAVALQKMLPAGEFRLSQVLAYLGPQVIWSEGRLFWRQTLKLAFVPVHLDFWFRPSSDAFFLEKPAVDKCRIGQLPLGGILGSLLWSRFAGITTAWDRALGLQNGAVWSWDRGDLFRIDTPPVLGRKDEKRQADPGGRKKPEFKESITARELAQVFADGDGDVYLNRTINLTGRIKSVSSTRRLGNSLASEMTRSTLAKAGGPEAVSTVAPSGLEDFPDEFILDTSQDELDTKIKVKVLVKCPHTYSLDTRGDLYRSGTSPNLDTPAVARQKQALFKAGRVEGMERNVIEVYGAQPPEEVP
ncbi:MAG: hypothetical protein EBT50_04760 [Verrucomicrobia bacterium]|nr:hypothetical protein [Verrucomicrobiota bacterium]